jgi:hypothetical protein
MTTAYGLQFDSVDVLPFTPALQALYINGDYATPARYGPGRIYIDVLGTAPSAAFWLDVENGDASPDRAPGWLDERHATGAGWGGIYCDESNLPAVVQACGTRPWSLWLATLDGTIPGSLSVPPTFTLVAVQAFPSSMVGINADVSLVLDRAYWEGRARK